MKNQKEKEISLAISKIKVVKLFGKFTYHLPLEDLENEDKTKMLILYGDNGSGKTTILQLIFHILSLGEKSGHRTYISRTKFSEFEVRFTDGTKVGVYRKKGVLIGEFKMEVSKDDEIIGSIHFPIEEDFAVRHYDPKKWSIIKRYLRKLNYAIYFLSDTRAFLSDSFGKSSRRRIPPDVRNEIVHGSSISQARTFLLDDISFADLVEDYEEEYSPIHALKLAIRRAEQWVDSEVYRASSKADIDINTIYLNIIKRLSKTSATSKEPQTKTNLIEELNKLETRIIEYSEFRIISALDFKTLKRTLANAPEIAHPTIWQVVSPYFESIEAKLDSLKNIYERLNIFINSINQFFTDKEIDFKFYKGIEIRTNGDLLKPEFLSSGEKQLLLLFCNTLTSLDRPSIFIIDEPEMSLNVKWQRKLISALLKLAEDSQVQFIFATHSLELLTQHKNHLVKLESI